MTYKVKILDPSSNGRGVWVTESKHTTHSAATDAAYARTSSDGQPRRIASGDDVVTVIWKPKRMKMQEAD